MTGTSQQSYQPSSLVELLHLTLHLDSQLHQTSNSFGFSYQNPYNDYVKSLLPIPCIIATVGIISVIIFCFTLISRACCDVCKCAPTQKLKENGALDTAVCVNKIFSMKNLTRVFYLTAFLAVVSDQALYYGYQFIGAGVSSGILSLNKLSIFFGNVDKFCRSLLKNSLILSTESSLCGANATDLSATSTTTAQFNSTMASYINMIDPISTFVTTNTNTLADYGTTDFNVNVWLVYGFALFVVFVFEVGICYENKVILQAGIAISVLLIAVCVSFGAIEMILLMATADYCMDPMGNTLKLFNPTVPSHSLMQYYTACSGINPMQMYLMNLTSIVDSYANGVQTLQELGQCSKQVSLMETQVKYMYSNIEAIYNQSDCSYIRQTIMDLSQSSICDSSFTGLFVIWASQYFTTTCIFIVAAIVSIICQFYGTYWEIESDEDNMERIRNKPEYDYDDMTLSTSPSTISSRSKNSFNNGSIPSLYSFNNHTAPRNKFYCDAVRSPSTPPSRPPSQPQSRHSSRLSSTSSGGYSGGGGIERLSSQRGLDNTPRRNGIVNSSSRRLAMISERCEQSDYGDSYRSERDLLHEFSCDFDTDVNNFQYASRVPEIPAQLTLNSPPIRSMSRHYDPFVDRENEFRNIQFEKSLGAKRLSPGNNAEYQSHFNQGGVRSHFDCNENSYMNQFGKNTFGFERDRQDDYSNHRKNYDNNNIRFDFTSSSSQRDFGEFRPQSDQFQSFNQDLVRNEYENLSPLRFQQNYANISDNSHHSLPRPTSRHFDTDTYDIDTFTHNNRSKMYNGRDHKNSDFQLNQHYNSHQPQFNHHPDRRNGTRNDQTYNYVNARQQNFDLESDPHFSDNYQSNFNTSHTIYDESCDYQFPHFLDDVDNTNEEPILNRVRQIQQVQLSQNNQIFEEDLQVRGPPSPPPTFQAPENSLKMNQHSHFELSSLSAASVPILSPADQLKAEKLNSKPTPSSASPPTATLSLADQIKSVQLSSTPISARAPARALSFADEITSVKLNPTGSSLHPSSLSTYSSGIENSWPVLQAVDSKNTIVSKPPPPKSPRPVSQSVTSTSSSDFILKVPKPPAPPRPASSQSKLSTSTSSFDSTQPQVSPPLPQPICQAHDTNSQSNSAPKTDRSLSANPPAPPRSPRLASTQVVSNSPNKPPPPPRPTSLQPSSSSFLLSNSSSNSNCNSNSNIDNNSTTSPSIPQNSLSILPSLQHVTSVSDDSSNPSSDSLSHTHPSVPQARRTIFSQLFGSRSSQQIESSSNDEDGVTRSSLFFGMNPHQSTLSQHLPLNHPSHPSNRISSRINLNDGKHTKYEN